MPLILDTNTRLGPVASIDPIQTSRSNATPPILASEAISLELSLKLYFSRPSLSLKLYYDEPTKWFVPITL